MTPSAFLLCFILFFNLLFGGFLLINDWHPFLHLSLSLLLTFWVFRKKAITWPSTAKLSWVLLGFLVCLWFQMHPVLHWRASHDPSAYLVGAYHLAKTKTFFFEHPWAQELYRQKDYTVLPYLNQTTAPGPELLSRNYGLLPVAPGKFVYHGFPLPKTWLALSVLIFGAPNVLLIHLLFMITSLCLMADLLYHFSKNSQTVGIGLTLFSLCPLLHWVFREPLSEPLAMTLFLGLLYASVRTDEFFWRAVAIGCFLSLLLVRVGSLLYLPFYLLFFTYVLKFKEKLSFGILLCVMLGLSWYGSPIYASEIVSFYLKYLGVELGSRLTLGFFSLVLFLGCFLIFWKWPRWVSQEALEKTVQKMLPLMMTLIGIGVGIRYFRLYKNPYPNVSSFPFVAFSLDSLLFYASPVVTVLGFFFWIFRRPKGFASFLFQGILIFLLFFYGVFRFFPLVVQPNFQRYLLIELIPLLVIGTACLLPKDSYVLFRRTGLYLGVVWLGALSIDLRHPSLNRNGFHDFTEWGKKLQADNPHVLWVVINPSWYLNTFLMPFTNIEPKPVVFLSGPSLKPGDEKLIERLEKTYQLKSVILSSSPVLSSHLIERTKASICSQYPSFTDIAPPHDLETSCAQIYIYEKLVSESIQS